VNMKHINKIVKSLKLELLPPEKLIELFNQVATEGVINLESLNIDNSVDNNLKLSSVWNLKRLVLYDLPFVAERLREIFFQCIISLSSSSLTPSENTEIRRKNWCGLTYDAKLLVTPLGALETYRNLFAVHPSVTISELLSVKNLNSFHILEKSEWVRVVEFGEHLRSFTQHKLTSMKVINKAMSFRLSIPAVSIADYVVESTEPTRTKLKGVKCINPFQEREINGRITVWDEHQAAEDALVQRVEWNTTKAQIRKNHRELEVFDDSSLFHSVFHM